MLIEVKVNLLYHRGEHRQMNRFELILLRLKAGLRQYELAQLLGVPATAVCDLERGRRPITLEVEKRIKQAIDKAKKGNVAASAKR